MLSLFQLCILPFKAVYKNFYVSFSFFSQRWEEQALTVEALEKSMRGYAVCTDTTRDWLQAVQELKARYSGSPSAPPGPSPPAWRRLDRLGKVRQAVTHEDRPALPYSTL